MIRIKTAGLPLLALLYGFAFSAAAQAQELEKLPYVPTPQIVVDEMLKMAGVNAKDFVVDLGSGDGRMIITAARDFKANGLGVDIDPKLVELAKQPMRATKPSATAPSSSSKICSRPTSARPPSSRSMSCRISWKSSGPNSCAS